MAATAFQQLSAVDRRHPIGLFVSLLPIYPDSRMSRRRLSRAAMVRLAIVVCINGILFAIGATSIVTTFRAQRTDPVLHYQAAPVLSLEHLLWLLPLLL